MDQDRRTDEPCQSAVVRAGADGRVLAHQNIGAKATQDWTRHDVMFNSLENEALHVYVGVCGETKGQAWVDDMTCVEAPFVNLVRRTAARSN